MSAGQTGHVTGQMGHVHGTDGTHTKGCPAKIPYVYCFFSFPSQDAFDHDRGQKSGISGRCLHWIFGGNFSPVDFFLFSRFSV